MIDANEGNRDRVRTNLPELANETVRPGFEQPFEDNGLGDLVEECVPANAGARATLLNRLIILVGAVRFEQQLLPNNAQNGGMDEQQVKLTKQSVFRKKNLEGICASVRPSGP